MNETKKCKHCLSEINKMAKVCPFCQKKQGGKVNFIVIGIIVFFIIIGALSRNDEKSPEEFVQEANSNNDSNKIKTESDNTLENTTVTPTATPTETVATYLEENEIPYLYSDVSKYIGRRVKITGKIFAEPEIDENAVYFQMFQNPISSENNTIISYVGETELKDGDYVVVDGEILSEFKGENAFGGAISAPAIGSTDIKVVSYADIIAPAEKTLELKESKQQNSYEIILEKVEFAKKETRLYITINNNGKANFSAYPFNMKIIQNKKQYEEQDNWDADYPEIQDDLYPDTSTSGIVCFPVISQDDDFTVYIDGHSDDYNEDFDEYKFDIKQ